MEQFFCTCAFLCAIALVVAFFNGRFKQKDCYINLTPEERFRALCRLTPYTMEADEELFFVSSACSLALTSRKLLLWVRNGAGHRLIAMPVEHITALLPNENYTGGSPAPEGWPEIPRFIAQHRGPRHLIPLYLQVDNTIPDLESQILALDRQDASDFSFWFEYAQALNWRA